MTEEERNEEGVDESIEDLEAPARALQDVAGGAAAACTKPSCNATLECSRPSCDATEYYCKEETASRNVVVYEQ